MKITQKKYIFLLLSLCSFLNASFKKPQNAFECIAQTYRLKDNVILNKNNFKKVASLLNNHLLQTIEIYDETSLNLDERVELHAEHPEVIKKFKQDSNYKKIKEIVEKEKNMEPEAKIETLNRILSELSTKTKLKEYLDLLSTPHLTHTTLLSENEPYPFFDETDYIFPDFNNNYKEHIITFFWNKEGTDINNFRNNYYLGINNDTMGATKYGSFQYRVSNFTKDELNKKEKTLPICQQLIPFAEGIILKVGQPSTTRATAYSKCFNLANLSPEQEREFIKTMQTKERTGAEFCLISGERSITKYHLIQNSVKKLSFQNCSTLKQVFDRAMKNKWIPNAVLTDDFWRNLLPLAPESYSNITFFTGWDLEGVKIYNETFYNPVHKELKKEE